jgi:hypothetical protein
MSKLQRIEEIHFTANPRKLAGIVDPSAGAGVAAPEGSTYMRYVATAGELYVKTGAADTAWQRIAGALTLTQGRAGMYVDNGGTQQTGLTGAFVKVLGFAANYGAPLYYTPDHTQDKITYGGTPVSIVEVVFQISFLGTPNSTLTFLAYDSFGNPIPGLGCRRKLSSGGDVGSAGFVGQHATVTGDSVEVRVSSDAQPTGTITPVYMQLMAHQIG